MLMVFYFAVLTFILMPFAMYVGSALLGMLLFLIAVLVGGFAVDPKVFSAMFGLLVRPFPRLGLKHAKFEDWLQFDLDWDDQHR
ncbi:MAG: hypothetical protein ABJR46_04080 [Tateyamaria sp.]|uniref:hypothetical protein n=1 Tax=Tateyamaria sp. TaxID=1929288 RepID=UPI0032A087C3